MSLENPSQSQEKQFIEKFPHLSHLTPEQQKKFEVLHTHNEKREAHDKHTEEELLRQLEAPLHQQATTMNQEVVPEKIDTPEKKTPSRATKIATNVVDFIPVIGSAKMVIEALRGKQFGTENEISGKIRLLHGGAGVVFFALDITGIGAIASELGKVGIKTGLKIDAETLAKEAIEKLGEKTALKQEGVKLAEIEGSAVLKKEGEKLAARGQSRVNKGEKIANPA